MDAKKRFLVDYYVKNLEFVKAPNVAFWIACQFALESNFGTSKLAVDYCNICGMKYPRIRHSLAVSSVNGGFASFNSTYQCVSDYFIRNAYCKAGQSVYSSVSNIKQFLRNSAYCLDKGYFDRIDTIYHQYYDAILKDFADNFNDNYDDLLF